MPPVIRCEHEWFAPHLEFRFPKVGDYAVSGIELELRQAIEPWHVLGEEGAVRRHGALRRFVGGALAGQAQWVCRRSVTC